MVVWGRPKINDRESLTVSNYIDIGDYGDNGETYDNFVKSDNDENSDNDDNIDNADNSWPSYITENPDSQVNALPNH